MLQGPKVPVIAELRADLESVVRRLDEVRSMGSLYQGIELSRYMQSLLRVSQEQDKRETAAQPVDTALSASL
jgi:hypothetical protein